MKESRTLSLKREPLSSLTHDDLRSVVGGYAIITERMTACLTPIIDPSDNTYVCTDSCFQ